MKTITINLKEYREGHMGEFGRRECVILTTIAKINKQRKGSRRRSRKISYARPNLDES